MIVIIAENRAVRMADRIGASLKGDFNPAPVRDARHVWVCASFPYIDVVGTRAQHLGLVTSSDRLGLRFVWPVCDTSMDG